jgi:hypothetical protein
VSNCARILVLSALVNGCQKAPDDTGDTHPDDTDVVAPECAGDDECRPGSICTDDGACAEGDRDNSFADATPIFQETPLSGMINPEGDIDYYAYTSVGEEWLRIETTPDEVEDGVDTVVSVFNAGGGLHAIEDDFPFGNVSGFDTVLYVYLPTAGVWYISVEDKSSNESYSTSDDPLEGGLAYTYTLNLRPMGGATRETDSIGDPSVEIKLDNGSTSFATGVLLEEPGDVDWISMSLPFEHGPIEIRGNAIIPEAGSDAESRVEIYSPSGELVARKDGVGPGGTALYLDTTKDTWMIGASDADGGGGDRHWYVLYLRTREVDYYDAQFAVEPDDSEAPALDTTVATTSGGEDYRQVRIAGEFEEIGDVDRFVVEALSDEYVSVLCSADSYGSLGDPKVRVIDEDGAELGSGEDGLDRAPDVYNVQPSSPGYVTVEMSAEDDVVGPSAYYTCMIYLTGFEVAQ